MRIAVNVNRYNRGEYGLCGTLVLLCIMFLLRDNFNVGIPLVAFVAISTIGMIFFEKVHFAAFGICLTLFSHGIQTYYILLIAIAIYFFKYVRRLMFNRVFLYLICIIICELFHILIQPFDIIEFFRYAISYFFLALFLGDSTWLTTENSEKIFRTYLYTYCFTMIDILLQLLKSYGSLGTLFTTGVRFGKLVSTDSTQLVTLYDNENMIAFFSLLSISVCLEMLLSKRTNKVEWSILCCVSVFFGLSTYSKAFVMVLAILFFIAFIGLIKNREFSSIKKIAIFIGCGIAIVVAINTLFSNIVINILDRFAAGDFTSGRSDLFVDYNRFMSDNPKYWGFGIGLQSLREKTGIGNTPHNGVQETFVCFGIFGLIIFIAIFLKIIKTAKCVNKNIVITNYLALIAFCIYTQSIQFVRLPSIFLMLILISASLVYRVSGEAYDDYVEER